MRFRITSVAVTATSLALGAQVTLAQQNPGRPALPPQAIEVAPDVFNLGFAIDLDGRLVEGYAFVWRERGNGQGNGFGQGRSANARPPGVGGGNGKDKEGTESSCYAELARGAQWRGAEPFHVNDTGSPVSNLRGRLEGDIGKWETAAGSNLIGSGFDSEAVVNLESVDGMNVVQFDAIADPGVIAVTNVWGIFGGPPRNRELVEWDQLYDDVDYCWATDGNPNCMDWSNIATHEVGHALGLGHPDLTCTEETMHRYASEGETMKRDLNAGDIAGINSLY